MEKRKAKISKTKIVIAILALLLAAFGIYNIVWFRYVRQFDVFVNNEKLQAIRNKPTTAPEFLVRDGVEIPYSYSRYYYEELEDGWVLYSFKDKDYNETDGYIYSIAVPPYLITKGNIQAMRATDDFIISVVISPVKWEYFLMIGEPINNVTDSYTSIVDKNGQPLGRHSSDTEESYQKWLALYEKYNPQITEMFATVNDMFGDALR